MFKWFTSSPVHKLTKGQIPAIRIGRAWRFDKDVIDDWIRTGQNEKKASGNSYMKGSRGGSGKKKSRKWKESTSWASLAYNSFQCYKTKAGAFSSRLSGGFDGPNQIREVEDVGIQDKIFRMASYCRSIILISYDTGWKQRIAVLLKTETLKDV